MSSQRHNLFVYGSLKRGCNNHSLMADQHFVAIAKTLPRYKLYALGNYPAMIEVTKGGRSIQGEIWQVDSACLARLDKLEDTAHGMYTRVPIHLLPPNDSHTVEGYIYLLSVTGRAELGEVWIE